MYLPDDIQYTIWKMYHSAHVLDELTKTYTDSFFKRWLDPSETLVSACLDPGCIQLGHTYPENYDEADRSILDYRTCLFVLESYQGCLNCKQHNTLTGSPLCINCDYYHGGLTHLKTAPMWHSYYSNTHIESDEDFS